ncbi:Acb2/Tad1 domain-containing protein [Salibacterium aidingense]|uniref:Acb2/Tad1 domain-containing protein n=1 Tax=Salibacterium aidingense TaxID=384933 RepID=UPI000429FFD2|nr:hypothetical protein [Salibacterium aidingense]
MLKAGCYVIQSSGAIGNNQPPIILNDFIVTSVGCYSAIATKYNNFILTPSIFSDGVMRVFRFKSKQLYYHYTRIREKELDYLIDQESPGSREKSLGITNLETAVMWSNASIARNEY